MNDGQTRGIPIGPDASKIIAETVLAPVDGEVAAEVDDQMTGVRHVDDFWLFFYEHSTAEQALSRLQTSLSEMELALNPRKTSVMELPTAFEDPWKSTLRNYNIRFNGWFRFDIIRFFDTVFQLAQKNPDGYVIKYAVRRVVRECIDNHLDAGDVELVLSHLTHAIRRDPGTLQCFIQFLTHHYQLLCEEPQLHEGVEEFLNRYLATKAEQRHSFEASWLVSLFVLFKDFDLADEVFDRCEVTREPLVLIPLFEYSHRRGQNKPSVPSEDLDLFFDWLLTYELGHRFEVDEALEDLEDDEYFSTLHEEGVEFYSPPDSLTCAGLEEDESPEKEALSQINEEVVSSGGGSSGGRDYGT
jgi:hypothetical protein